MAILRVYPANEKYFTDNGLKAIDVRKALIHKENNGDYYLSLKCHIKFADYIVHDNIVIVMTPWGLEGFRLDNPIVDGTTIECKAWQLFYDGDNLVVPSTKIEGLTGTNALSTVNANAVPLSPFVVSGNVTSTASVEFTNDNLSNCMLALAGTYGAYLERNLFTVNIKNSLGEDRQQVIALGKNMTTYKQQEIWDNVVTQLMPIGYDGILLEDIYLHATDVAYDKPYCKAVQFNPSDGIDTEDTNAVKADLLSQATVYLNAHKVPEVSYTMTANLDYVELGDTIHVKHPMVSVDLLTAVNSFEYDCITEKYQNITFGNAVISTKSKVQASLNSKTQTLSHDVINLGKSLEESKNTIKHFLYEGHKYETDNATYFLNADTPEQATKFMIISLGGVGFGTKQLGNAITGDESYTTAWTIDGNFNANFISTGTLESIFIKACSIELSTNGNKNRLFLNPTTIKMQKVTGNTTTDIFYLDSNGNLKIEIDGSDIDMANNSSIKAMITANTDLVKTEISQTYATNVTVSDLQSTVSNINSQKKYELTIVSSNGNIFKNGSISTILTAIVKSWDTDVTATIDPNQLIWTRVSSDINADEVWNTSHAGGSKSIVITKEDVRARATFFCDLIDTTTRKSLL